jgi:hypothetical protein
MRKCKLRKGISDMNNRRKKMKKIITLSLTAVLFIFSCATVNSFAEEILLCISEEDQSIVMVDSKEDCLEDETLTELNGNGLAEKKSMTPLANFKPYEDCDGEGNTREIGFDENSNGTLDAGEIMSVNRKCNPTLPAESE